MRLLRIAVRSLVAYDRKVLIQLLGSDTGLSFNEAALYSATKDAIIGSLKEHD